jgi:hypothetical protein
MHLAGKPAGRQSRKDATPLGRGENRRFVMRYLLVTAPLRHPCCEASWSPRHDRPRIPFDRRIRCSGLPLKRGPVRGANPELGGQQGQDRGTTRPTDAARCAPTSSPRKGRGAFPSSPRNLPEANVRGPASLAFQPALTQSKDTGPRTAPCGGFRGDGGLAAPEFPGDGGGGRAADGGDHAGRARTPPAWPTRSGRRDPRWEDTRGVGRGHLVGMARGYHPGNAQRFRGDEAERGAPAPRPNATQPSGLVTRARACGPVAAPRIKDTGSRTFWLRDPPG